LQAFRQANPDLARLMEAWPDLSEADQRIIDAILSRNLPLHIRTSILALVDASGPRTSEGGKR
jgi:hypothetical protein